MPGAGMSAQHEAPHYDDSDLDEHPIDWPAIDARAEACVRLKAELMRQQLGEAEATDYLAAHHHLNGPAP